MTIRSIGIVGAGKLGITLAQLALKAGYEVFISASGAKERIALTVSILAPGAVALTTSEMAKRSDVIILALPLGKFQALAPHLFDGKMVIDAMNYWWEIDGPREDIIPNDVSSSEAVQAFLPGARVVKALNHMGYHDLHDEAKQRGEPGRKAIAVAGDNASDVAAVAGLIDALGFDPLVIGPLSSGRQLEAGGPVFGANEPVGRLRSLLAIGTGQA